jgi:DNA-binding MarR family transcriptional regulator
MEKMISNLNDISDEKFLFGTLFITSNKLDTLLDRELRRYSMTSRQWFLLVTLETLFLEPPTIKQAANAMGTSHQNVKQVALKLAQKGFVAMEKDANDARATRLSITDQCREFWAQTQHTGDAFMQAVFEGIGPAELQGARKTMQALWKNIIKIEKQKFI